VEHVQIFSSLNSKLRKKRLILIQLSSNSNMANLSPSHSQRPVVITIQIRLGRSGKRASISTIRIVESRDGNDYVGCNE
jgi:hypothetical protein